jgi:hypothetical protein
MKKSFTTLFFLVLCTTCLSGQAHAGVTLYTDLVHIDWGGENIMVGVAHTYNDYGSAYCVDVDNYLYRIENGEEVESIQTTYLGECEESQVHTETILPYVEGSDYHVEGVVTATPVYNYENYPYGYYDPAGYAYYNQRDIDGDPLMQNWWHNFTSTGSPTTSPFASFFLGYVYSFLPFGTTSRANAPHHLWVVSDRDIVRTDTCHQVNKLIDFEIVDDRNFRAGRVFIDEEPRANLVDSCSNLTVVLNRCSIGGVKLSGEFTDSLRTGCPTWWPLGTPWDRDPFCGFSNNNVWRKCSGPPGATTTVLARMFYDVRHALVRVDGEADMTDNRPKFP